MAGIDDHYTDRLSGEASSFVESRRTSDRPVFMQVSARDIHPPLLVPERHRAAYPGERAPRPPSFDEENVSDEHAWVRGKTERRNTMTSPKTHTS